MSESPAPSPRAVGAAAPFVVTLAQAGVHLVTPA